MNTDLQSLSLEPLVYMLMHSAVFVAVVGLIFFVIGLIFGYATWGRYKRQTRMLEGQAIEMKEEIAQLKRRVGDRAVKAEPVAAMATETIHMPPREAKPSAPAVSPGDVESGARPHEFQPPAGLNGRKPGAEPVKAKATSPLATIITTPALPKETRQGLGGDASPRLDLSVISVLSDIPELPGKESEVLMTDDPLLGPIYTAAPPKFDDLTALKGVSKVLEKRLNDLGIYTYAQIAGWNDAQIQEVSFRLAFKDRIHREHWVEQAQELLAGMSPPAVQNPPEG